MTKEEAIQELRTGKKLTHPYIQDQQYDYIYLPNLADDYANNPNNGDIVITSETKYDFIKFGQFWRDRASEGWDTKWEVYHDKPMIVKYMIYRIEKPFHHDEHTHTLNIRPVYIQTSRSSNRETMKMMHDSMDSAICEINKFGSQLQSMYVTVLPVIGVKDSATEWDEYRKARDENKSDSSM